MAATVQASRTEREQAEAVATVLASRAEREKLDYVVTVRYR